MHFACHYHNSLLTSICALGRADIYRVKFCVLSLPTMAAIVGRLTTQSMAGPKYIKRTDVSFSARGLM